MQPAPLDFDIDLDLSPLLGALAGPTLINARWYELISGRPDRPPALQRKIQEAFHRSLMFAEWRATRLRHHERRRAVRVPLVSPVLTVKGPRLVTTDISLSGLRCSGRPAAPLLDIEFRLPGIAFPIDARAEVVTFRDSSVIPLLGMRFVSMDRAYVDLIEQFIDKRSRHGWMPS
jgi:hypothetical protein